MNKHTPGPWFYDDSKEMIFGDGEVVVYETNTNEHDCSLIAAAPDLLEALEFVQDCLVKCLTGGEIKAKVAAKSIGQAAMAIAKARGEA